MNMKLNIIVRKAKPSFLWRRAQPTLKKVWVTLSSHLSWTRWAKSATPKWCLQMTKLKTGNLFTITWKSNQLLKALSSKARDTSSWVVQPPATSKAWSRLFTKRVSFKEVHHLLPRPSTRSEGHRWRWTLTITWASTCQDQAKSLV